MMFLVGWAMGLITGYFLGRAITWKRVSKDIENVIDDIKKAE
jgi:hypothetical protein